MRAAPLPEHRRPMLPLDSGHSRNHSPLSIVRLKNRNGISLMARLANARAIVVLTNCGISRIRGQFAGGAADFAACISGHNISEITRLHGLAGRNGAGRASAQALLLAQEFFAVTWEKRHWLSFRAKSQIVAPPLLAECTWRAGSAGGNRPNPA